MAKSVAKLALPLILALNAVSALSQQPQPRIQSWMDGQFGTSPNAIATDCNATVFNYDEVAQVNGWDCSADRGGLTWIEVARPERVNREQLNSSRKEVVITGRTTSDGVRAPDVQAYQVGNPKTAKFAVIFVHGAGGDKRLGARDTNMGGNFNRLMNLVLRSQGVYYTPTVDFSDRGEAIQSIIDKLQRDNPGVKAVIACGSAGGETCGAVARREDAISHLAGIMFTGAASGIDGITDTAAYKSKVPMIIAHGSRDGVDTFLEAFKKMRGAPGGSDYPVWMQVFNDGGHGTPIRMIDWKESLNWIFAHAPEKQTHSNCPPSDSDLASPEVHQLESNVRKVVAPASAITCDQFLKFPFIRSRPGSGTYTATKKSSCMAPRKEETPGEDLHIVNLK